MRPEGLAAVASRIRHTQTGRVINPLILLSYCVIAVRASLKCDAPGFVEFPASVAYLLEVMRPKLFPIPCWDIRRSGETVLVKSIREKHIDNQNPKISCKRSRLKEPFSREHAG